MIKRADVSTKKLISLAPDNWVQWVTFATFVLESMLVQEIMRWDMAVLRESPWYQDEQRGRREQMVSNIATILEVKFGTEGLELMPQITQSDLAQLQEILRSIVAASTITEVRDLL
ncbi:hypothetical protein [Gloeocapsopsis crepidinum]|uniref:hypothetical protein n=1 Tax=Gloeocapsopsis crepidinum TaxID=693223 RepID=UPI001D157FE3|nr:hypothetical protein [Gloeocapsopsis crepidinum]